VTHVWSVDVKGVWRRVTLGVAVGGCHGDDYLRAGWDRGSADRHRLDGVAERRVRYGRVVAKDFLYGGGAAGGVGAQYCELGWMPQEADDPIADQAGRGVVAGDDQLEQRREQLLLRQAFVAVASRDQAADEIIRGSPLFDGDQRGQHGHDYIRCS